MRWNKFLLGYPLVGRFNHNVGINQLIHLSPPSNCTHVEGPFIPTPKIRHGESTELKRARLLYQSRKRGMLENGLILSNFAAKYLSTFDSSQLKVYDELINKPSNDWDIYYWVTGAKPTPSEYESNVMNLLKKHVRNESKEVRNTQPNL